VSDLHAKLKNVRDRDTFFDFVDALIEDRVDKAKDEQRYPYGGQPDGWENSTIEDYLAAALAWARASQHLSTEPSWRAFAELLYCGKIYE
jgi:hypothetical protein